MLDLFVRHVEMPQASDWSSHAGNHLDAWVAAGWDWIILALGVQHWLLILKMYE